MQQITSTTDLLLVFMLAAFLGFQLIKRVSPLMSLTNAIAAVGGGRRDYDHRRGPREAA